MIKIGNKIESNNLSNNLFDINKSDNETNFRNFLTSEINNLEIENTSSLILSNSNQNNYIVLDIDSSNNTLNKNEEEKLNINSFFIDNDIILKNKFDIPDNLKDINSYNNKTINNLDTYQTKNDNPLGIEFLEISTSNIEFNHNQINNLNTNSFINQKFNEDELIELENNSIKFENKNLNILDQYLNRFSRINYNSDFVNYKNLVNNVNKENLTLLNNKIEIKDNSNNSLNFKLNNPKSYGNIDNDNILYSKNNFNNTTSENTSEKDINLNCSNKEINNYTHNQSNVKIIIFNNTNINQKNNNSDNLISNKIVSDNVSENNFKHTLNPNLYQNIDLEDKLISLNNGEKYENNNNQLKNEYSILKDNSNNSLNFKLNNPKSYGNIDNDNILNSKNNFNNTTSENTSEKNINLNISNKEINNYTHNQSNVKIINFNNTNINQKNNNSDNLISNKIISDKVSENNFKHNLNPYFSQNIDFDQNTISIPDREKFENNSLKDNFNNSIINKNEFSYRLNKDNQTNQNPNNDLSKPKIANNINKTDDKYFFANVLDNLKTNNLVNKDINNIDKSLNINNYNLSIDNLKENLIKFIKYDIKDDNFKAKINLQPKSLGNLLIEISQNQGNINIQFNVDNQDTVKLIDNTLYNFKDRLIQSGLLNNNNDVNINIQLNLTNYNQNENQRNNSKQSKVNKKYSIENITNTAIEKDTKTKIYNKFNGGKIVEKYI